MKNRAFYLDSFIRKHHLQIVTWLSSDASSRRYARVKKKTKTYILMDSPLSEKPKEFVKVDKLLRKHRVNAPKIYAKDLRHGFLLLEDLGAMTLSQAIKDKTMAHDLYIKALDTLIHLQKSVKEYSQLPLAYNQMFQENQLFIDYYAPYIRKIALSKTAKDEFNQIWRKLFLDIKKLPRAIVLYDYHLDNLMLKEDGTIGLLDFQDALCGPIFYDLISFLEDERLPLPKAQRKSLLQHYLALRPVLAEKKYADWIPVVAAHRHTRVIGIFARLAIKYKKPQYLKFIDNDWLFLKENLQSPLLKEYVDWLKRYLPKQMKKRY